MMQSIQLSISDIVAEKEEAVELAVVGDKKKAEPTATLKMSPDIVINNSLEEAEQLSLGGETKRNFEKETYFSLPEMPLSFSNSSFHSTSFEADQQIMCTIISNPKYVKDEDTQS